MSPIDDEVPQADCRDSAPHPRNAVELFGQASGEAAFLEARAQGRLHHAWLIAGPEGIGKATLAWRVARFLIAEGAEPANSEAGLFGDAPPPPRSLDIAPDHPVARRMAALSEPRLFLLRRPWDADRKRLRKEITVDAARDLQKFFGMSAADGGHRVVIVDAADELNPNAANALLKLIEEPPPRCTLLLVCHRPAALLPTIRSRCRLLRCAALDQEDLARALTQAGAALPDDPKTRSRLAQLAGGSAGYAWDLLMLGGLELDATVGSIFAGLPGHDHRAALKLADRLGGPSKTAERKLLYRLVGEEIAALARTGALGEEASAPWRTALAPGPESARTWADSHGDLTRRLSHAEAVNLDPHSVILDMVRRIDEVAARAGRR